MSLSKELEKVFAKKPEVNGSIQGARNLKKSAPGMSVYKFPSKKAGATLYVEGNLEHAGVIVLEAASTVKDYRSQPIKTQLDAKHFSIPDFAVKKTDGVFKILEIKPSKTALTVEQQDRFFAAEQLYAREGIEFQLVDQYQLPDTKSVLRLLNLYCRGHRTNWRTYEKESSLDLLKLDCYPTISCMQEILAEENLPIHIAEHLVFHQRKKTADTNCLFTNLFNV